MRTIYKYELAPEYKIVMPAGPILSVLSRQKRIKRNGNRWEAA